MTTHELKTWPEFFEAVAQGEKRHEVRKDDRGFAVGDVLRLREWLPDARFYTERECFVRVTHITRRGPAVWSLPEDVCVMSIERLTDQQGDAQP